MIAERVAETGLERLMTPCVQFCGNAWMGGQDPQTPSEMTEAESLRRQVPRPAMARIRLRSTELGDRDVLAGDAARAVGGG